jgi:hypothetical protein
VALTPAFITGVVDTSEQLIACVVGASEQIITSVVETSDKYSFVNILANFQKNLKWPHWNTQRPGEH